MDKYEYNVKSDQIKKLYNRKEFAAAAEIADEIDWSRVKDNKMLTLVADIYEGIKDYEKAKEVLLIAYERTTMGRQLAYKLTILALRTKNFVEADEFYSDFVEMSPTDVAQYLLKYRIAKAKGEDVEVLIKILEAYVESEMDERWQYELAKLYHEAGQDDKCISACDELELWFSDGKYVEKAKTLKKIITSVMDDYNKRYGDINQIKKENEDKTNDNIVNEVSGEAGDTLTPSVKAMKPISRVKVNTSEEDIELNFKKDGTVEYTDPNDITEDAKSEMDDILADIKYDDIHEDEKKAREAEEAAKAAEEAAKIVDEAEDEADANEVSKAHVESEESQDVKLNEDEIDENEIDNEDEEEADDEEPKKRGLGNLFGFGKKADKEDELQDLVVSSVDEEEVNELALKAARRKRRAAKNETTSQRHARVVEKVKEDFLDEESEEDVYKTDEERRAETALKAAIEAADAAQKAADLANIMVEEARVHMLEVRKVTKQQQADEAEAEGNQELARKSREAARKAARSATQVFERVPAYGDGKVVEADMAEVSNNALDTVSDKGQEDILNTTEIDPNEINFKVDDSRNKYDTANIQEALAESMKRLFGDNQPDTILTDDDLDEDEYLADDIDNAPTRRFDIKKINQALEQRAIYHTVPLPESLNQEADGQIELAPKLVEEQVQGQMGIQDLMDDMSKPADIRAKEVAEAEEAAKKAAEEAKAEAERVEAERKAEEDRKAAEEAARLEAERIEAERKAEEERKAAEEAARLEAERLEAERKAEEERKAAEEAARLEAERIEAERKAEEERKAAEEAARLEAERIEAERKAEEERKAAEEAARLEAERIEAERKAEEERKATEEEARAEREAEEALAASIAQMEAEEAKEAKDLQNTGTDDNTEKDRETEAILRGLSGTGSHNTTTEINIKAISAMIDSSIAKEDAKDIVADEETIKHIDSAIKEVVEPSMVVPKNLEDFSDINRDEEAHKKEQAISYEEQRSLDVGSILDSLASVDEKMEEAEVKAEEKEEDKEPVSSGSSVIADKADDDSKEIIKAANKIDNATVKDGKIPDEYRNIFDNFTGIDTIESEVADTLKNLIDNFDKDGTSKSNNVIVTGSNKIGKSTLAIDIIKAANKGRDRSGRKVAKVKASTLNKNGVNNVFIKIIGSDLIIEQAGNLMPATLTELIVKLKNYTEEMLVVLEDDKAAIDRMLINSKELKKLFNNRVDIKELEISDMVKIARDYAREQFYEIDEMGELALSAKLDDLMGSSKSITVEDIEDIVDQAIEHASKFRIGNLLGKLKKNNSEFKTLSEQDFL